MGSLASNGLKGRIGHEWSEIKLQQSTIIKNNYSEQEFIFHTILNTELNNTKLYFTRQFSSLPKTPKIICLEKQKQNFLILVERGQKSITEWLNENHCELSILLKLKDVLSGTDALRCKFGPFLINQKMIKISPNDNLLIWYNEKFESNLIQLPLIWAKGIIENQLIMIQKIAQIFRKCVNKDFNINLFISGIKTFSDFKLKVRQRIAQIEYLFDSKTNSLKSIHKERKHFCLTPQKTTKVNNQKIKNYNLSHSYSQGKVNSAKINVSLSKIQSSKKIKQFKAYEGQKTIERAFFKRKQKTLSALDQKSSENYSSSSGFSSKNTRKDHQSELENEENTANAIFVTKQTTIQKFKFKKNFIKQQTEMYDLTRLERISYRQFQKVEQITQKEPKHTIFEAFNYKAADSFSSKKNSSLKTTSGTLKRTREFEDHFRQMMLEQRQAIKQQSDQTHKNSNNYSVEQSIKQDSKQQMKVSVTLSQDFNNLFSGGDSLIEGCMEDSMREREFQKILFGHH